MNLTVTARAVAKITELTRASGSQMEGLRIDLRPGGCCGTFYHFSLDLPASGDLVWEVSTARIITTPAVAQLVQGARLDYGAGLKPPRFRILRNPNTPVKCPCGRSFGSPYPGKSTPFCQAYTPMCWDQEGESGAQKGM